MHHLQQKGGLAYLRASRNPMMGSTSQRSTSQINFFNMNNPAKKYGGNLANVYNNYYQKANNAIFSHSNNRTNNAIDFQSRSNYNQYKYQDLNPINYGNYGVSDRQYGNQYGSGGYGNRPRSVSQPKRQQDLQSNYEYDPYMKIQPPVQKFQQQQQRQDAYKDYSKVVDEESNHGAIYLGNLKTAKDVNTLNQLGCKAVMTVCGDNISYSQYDVPQHIIFQCDDAEYQDLRQFFEKGFNFIDQNRKFTNIYIHCYAGISRSTTLLLAYLMKKYGQSLHQAFDQVSKRRPCVMPNNGFLAQLRKYEQDLKNQNQFSSNMTQQEGREESPPRQSYNSPHRKKQSYYENY